MLHDPVVVTAFHAHLDTESPEALLQALADLDDFRDLYLETGCAASFTRLEIETNLMTRGVL